MDLTISSDPLICFPFVPNFRQEGQKIKQKTQEKNKNESQENKRKVFNCSVDEESLRKMLTSERNPQKG